MADPNAELVRKIVERQDLNRGLAEAAERLRNEREVQSLALRVREEARRHRRAPYDQEIDDT